MISIEDIKKEAIEFWNKRYNLNKKEEYMSGYWDAKIQLLELIDNLKVIDNG